MRNTQYQKTVYLLAGNTAKANTTKPNITTCHGSRLNRLIRTRTTLKKSAIISRKKRILRYSIVDVLFVSAKIQIIIQINNRKIPKF